MELFNVEFFVDQKTSLLFKTTTIRGGDDTLRIFSSGTDATTGLNSSDISAKPKFAIKSVQGCTLLMMQRSRCAVYFQKQSMPCTLPLCWPTLQSAGVGSIAIGFCN